MSVRPPWAGAPPQVPVVPGFRLLRPLGHGAHGQVHVALVLRGPWAGQAVALKLLPTAAVDAQRLQPQVRALLALRHPAINPLLAAGEVPGWWWLALQLVPGTDLRPYTRPARRLPAALVLSLGARLADGLALAHRRGIVHRDIKPSNVLVHWPSDTVQLADFGIAHLADGSPSATGVVPGTPAYMAPEVLAGAPATDRSDVHALAAVLYELLSGERPYAGRTLGELLQHVATGQPRPLADWRPDLPAACQLAFGRALARDRAERPEAAAWAAELQRLARRADVADL